MTTLIKCGTLIPAEQTETFTTADDNQPSVQIQVYQGEQERAADNKLLGTYELLGIPPAPRGVPQIAVTFGVDAHGTVYVTARDLGTGKELNVNIKLVDG